MYQESCAVFQEMWWCIGCVGLELQNSCERLKIAIGDVPTLFDIRCDVSNLFHTSMCPSFRARVLPAGQKPASGVPRRYAYYNRSVESLLLAHGSIIPKKTLRLSTYGCEESAGVNEQDGGATLPARPSAHVDHVYQRRTHL
jgi:hypothetical protein